MIRGASIPRGAALSSWWGSRTLRERVLLGVMAAALAAYVAGTGVAQPLLAARAQALATIARHDAALARLGARPEGDAQPAPPPAGGPVTAVVAETARDYDLVIRRIEAAGDGARLEIEDAGFAEIILWIEELELRHALRIVAIEMDRRPEPGVVSARLTVTR